MTVDRCVVLAEQQSDLRCHIKCHLRNKLEFRVTLCRFNYIRANVRKRRKTKTSFKFPNSSASISFHVKINHEKKAYEIVFFIDKLFADL